MAAIYDRRNVEHSSTLQPTAELEQVEREIVATDEQIDELVYQLYGSRDEERRIVQGA